jgi:hypothetical protein
MHDDERRLARLRGLVVRLERLPESAQREWMLDQVRARMVDIDTGFPPQPLRPRRDVESERAAAARPAQRRDTTPPEPALDEGVEPLEAPPQESPPAAGETTEDRAEDRRTDGDEATPVLSDPDHVLWLDDSTDTTGSPAASDLPRWRRGLRG